MPFVHGLITGSVSGDDIADEVMRQLLSNTREEMNKLAISVEPGATVLNFQHDLGGIRAGAQVDIGMESFRVWSVDAGNKTATVEPGMNGSFSEAHEAGELVKVNTRLPKSSIFKALNDEIMSLSSPTNGLFRMKTATFTYSNTTLTYDLPGAGQILDIYDVRQVQVGPENYWPRLKGWRHDRNANTLTGHGLFLPYGSHGQTVQVQYKAPFSRLSDPGDDVAAVSGVPVEMQDILVLGTLLRLGPIREIRRNFTESQGDTRRAEEVAGGAIANSFSYVRQARMQRVNDEAGRLLQMYPPYRP